MKAYLYYFAQFSPEVKYRLPGSKTPRGGSVRKRAQLPTQSVQPTLHILLLCTHAACQTCFYFMRPPASWHPAFFANSDPHPLPPLPCHSYKLPDIGYEVSTNYSPLALSHLLLLSLSPGPVDLHSFDPVNMSWTQLSSTNGDPPSWRMFHGFTSLGGKLYVHGGWGPYNGGNDGKGWLGGRDDWQAFPWERVSTSDSVIPCSVLKKSAN